MTRAHGLFVAVLLMLAAAPARAQNTPGAPDTGHATPQLQTSPDARVAAPAVVSAQDRALEEKTKAVASQLRCPVCQGLSIQDSPSELARQMKALVREQLAAGKTPDEVKAYYISKYGSWILLEPPASGISILVYVLPALALLGGALFVVFITRRWLKNPHAATTPVDPERGPETSEV